jgi:poly(3-hydroxybutyrate) depolymerase
MRRTSVALLLTMLCSVLGSRAAAAAMIEKNGTFGGLKITYKVVLPDGFDPARAYPLILVFTGGPQTLEMAGATLETDWRAEGERRGYILISPGSPDGALFFEGGDRIFPEFLEQILRDYKVKDAILHIAGHSNGGLSAFHIAGLYPKYFSTVTGYPGALNGDDMERAPALKSMCLFMHVGDKDAEWMAGMQREAATLSQQGFKIRLTVEKNQVHRLKAQEINLSRRLYDEIETCKK